MWFIYALITMLLWGSADLFYKKGSIENEKYSHLKVSITVGLVMGIHAIATIIFGDVGYDFENILIYLPVSSMYIISMTLGYFGLRYLELSVVSPIQNASGALVTIMCITILGKTLDLPSGVAVILICVGTILLGIFERMKEEEYFEKNNKKYKIGFVAFLMPILYCVFDALGTFFDAYYLDDFEKTPLKNVTEDTFEQVANISYELTFFFVAVVLFIYVCVIKKEKFTFANSKDKGIAALLETGGQFTYVYAMSGTGAIAAPMVAAYCIVSLLLSRIFIKEKLSLKQYLSVALVIAGIIILGILEA